MCNFENFYMVKEQKRKKKFIHKMVWWREDIGTATPTFLYYIRDIITFMFIFFSQISSPHFGLQVSN